MSDAFRSPIRSAVFPVAGLGTRFLPAAKAIPKEMLPVVDRPLIQMAIDEAREAGIERFILVVGRDKHVLENHFDRSPELEDALRRRGRDDALNRLADDLPPTGSVLFTRQREPRGLGHAVGCARHAIGNEPFAVLLPDMVMRARPGCLRQMLDLYERVGGNVLASERVPIERISSYGALGVGKSLNLDGIPDGRAFKISDMIEKPSADDAPSNRVISGRYILQPQIFDAIDDAVPGALGEIQITDAMKRLLASQPFHGLEYVGETYDCGDRLGFLAANVAYALDRDDLRDDLADDLRRRLAELS